MEDRTIEAPADSAAGGTMLEGFVDYHGRLPQAFGAPRSAASNPLRTLAWMRYLLDHLVDVREQVRGRSPAPRSWRRQPADDRTMLRQWAGKGADCPIPEKPRLRRALLLDQAFGPLLSGAAGGSGKWFSSKLSSGGTRPDAKHLRWMNRLLPGSARAFLRPPAPLDPWFYDALDFTSPWFGRLFLWRAADPDFEDPAWDTLLSSAPTNRARGAIAQKVRAIRDTPWAADARERELFAGAIRTGLAYAAFPEEASAPLGVRLASERVDAARAARRQGEALAHPVTTTVLALPDDAGFVALSNAIAAYRLAGLIGLEDPSAAAWWLRGALDGMRDRIRKYQRTWFYTLTNGRAPLEGVLRHQDLWEPRASGICERAKGFGQPKAKGS